MDVQAEIQQEIRELTDIVRALLGMQKETFTLIKTIIRHIDNAELNIEAQKFSMELKDIEARYGREAS